MTSIIAHLWSGNLDPITQLGENNREIRELECLMQKNLEKLEADLSEKAAETLGKYSDCVSEYLAIISEQAFCDGFCLGTKILAEAMHRADQLTP